MQNSKLHRFSPRNFIVFHFIFQSMIYFELISEFTVRYMWRFIFLHIQSFQHYSLKSLFSLRIIVFGTIVEDQLLGDVWHCFCTLNSIPLIYISILMAAPRFDYCSFVIMFEIGKCQSSCFVLLC